jgi:type I restriction enzyme, S subunit
MKNTSGYWRRAGLTGILLSIKPKYVKEILSGIKQYEFRKQIFKNKSAKTVFIYSTSPQKKIVACFRLGEIVEGHPDYLWEQFWNVSGLNEREFFDYFSDRNTGYAIRIEDLKEYSEPVDPFTLFGKFVAPQSFYYVDQDHIQNQMRIIMDPPHHNFTLRV